MEQRPRSHALDPNAVRTSEGGRLRIRFKVTTALLTAIRTDLQRVHPFAYERVGFVSAGLSAGDGELLVLAREYQPVADDDYLRDPTVGAMMGPHAIRRALQWALRGGVSLFHVHTHRGHGIPSSAESTCARAQSLCRISSRWHHTAHMEPRTQRHCGRRSSLVRPFAAEPPHNLLC